MSRTARASVALALVLCAFLDDWVINELFMRRDTITHVVAALLINAAAFIGAAVLIGRALPSAATTMGLRICATLGFGVLMTSTLRAATAPSIALGPAARIGMATCLALAALLLAWKLSDALFDRLMRAIALAAVAFLLVPVAYRFASSTPRVWIAAETPSSVPRRHATLFLLLDELGYAAAAPFAGDLRAAGLKVRYTALERAGENTLNVIPAMFTSLDFSHARACGASTLCSGLNLLNFTALRVARSDVHVTGMLLPYCEIQGLASCFQVPLPHEYGSAYRSLLAFYFRRAGLSLPAVLHPSPEPPDQKRRLLQQQMAFIERSRFWSDGGILYAHLPMPHPPGLDGQTTLDGDYANNIEATRSLLAQYADRLRSKFGDDFSILITGDHPLRQYWCASGTYAKENCTIRAEFKDERVPLILASPALLPEADVTSNREVFQVLNRLANP